ncbi:hypothetical protein L207DRAFT_581405 [Hyaloscypha variabilis F]|uniref:2EXR domain-containing protein n=1 Tax=Hyaloscypha variabilis (strain UAMH 11265 / GT02V1 / F) TaxID=1149755 RepID=A0A2J6RW60_HYAVF|nr:hypothetical protein L207DRAFT_581405 [Hyaloscypha variabilis F]
MTSETKTASEAAFANKQACRTGAVGDTRIILREEENGPLESSEKAKVDTFWAKNTAHEAHPGAKALTIIDAANLSDTSISKFLANPPHQPIDLETFLRNIQSSAPYVETAQNALIVSEVLSQFIEFPKLPRELRDKIWEHAVEGGRIVDVYSKPAKVEKISRLITSYPRTERDRDLKLHVLQRPHLLLRVCQESRAIVLRKYSLQLGQKFIANNRIDPKEDLVCMLLGENWTSHSPLNQFSKLIWSSEALKLEKIAIDRRSWYEWHVHEILDTFKNLKQLIFLVRCQHEPGNINDRMPTSYFAVCVHYKSDLVDWWRKHGGGKDSTRVKPLLLGGRVVCGRLSCCTRLCGIRNCRRDRFLGI